MGRPVIAFGKHNIYSFLPTVQTLSSFDDLRAALRRALDQATPSATAEADGRRFLAAIEHASFDLRGFDYGRPDRFEPSVIDDMMKCLDSSLEIEARLAASSRRQAAQ